MKKVCTNCENLNRHGYSFYCGSKCLPDSWIWEEKRGFCEGKYKTCEHWTPMKVAYLSFTEEDEAGISFEVKCPYCGRKKRGRSNWEVGLYNSLIREGFFIDTCCGKLYRVIEDKPINKLLVRLNEGIM